jgi:hypothetical protein
LIAVLVALGRDPYRARQAALKADWAKRSVRFGSMLSKKSLAADSIAQNKEFQNPKSRVVESKFFTGAYSEKIFFCSLAKIVSRLYRSKAVLPLMPA